MTKSFTTRYSKFSTLLYTALLPICLLLISAAFLFTSAYKTNSFSESHQLSVSCTQLDEDTRELRFVAASGQGDCVLFYCNHSYLSAYIGDQLLYNLNDSNTFLGSSPGGDYHFLHLDGRYGEIRVVVQAVYPQSRNQEITFHQGDGIQMYGQILKDNLLRAIISLFNLFFCLVMLVLCFFGRHKFKFGQEIVWFCLFGLLASLWALTANPWMTLMCENRVAMLFMEYVLLMLMMPAAVLYIRAVFEPDVRHTWVSNALIVLGCFNTIILIVLHVTRVLEFKESVISTHLLMVAALIYSFVTVFRHIRYRGFTRPVKVALVSVSLLAVFFSLDVVTFYIGKTADIFGWLGISVCLLVMGINIFFEMYTAMEETHKNQIYKEIATHDVVTGLFNRNAYNLWLEEHPVEDGMCFITYDLNELKHCNDVYGHLVGDQYIRDAAQILRHIFDGAGDTFRLGGDEFITILNKPDSWIEKRLAELEQQMERYNATSEVIRMQIAYGYARFERDRDADYEETRRRADVEMYRKKVAMKAR